LKERGEKVVRTAPEAWDAAIELLEELVAYLPERYPSLFQPLPTGLFNLVTREDFNISLLTRNGVKEDPMALCARMVQDDLAIMVEKGNGRYYLLAGAILLAGFWRLEDKFGMPLSEIHTSGDVPEFREKLEKGMTNFFRRIQPQSPVLRNNYFIQVDDKLAWSESIGSEDAEGIGWFTAEKNKAIEHHWFRSERQSLRRYMPDPLLSFIHCWALFADKIQAPKVRRRGFYNPDLLPPHQGHRSRTLRPGSLGFRYSLLGRCCVKVQGKREIWRCAVEVSG
jgi:hypothetical protein